ncbi:MAG: T9SS type A sorting domain-containing protein [Bacteroidetes bacterium]|nr:T9SS type A sorting domain-containing protein [Bacteroidota bacterium]
MTCFSCFRHATFLCMLIISLQCAFAPSAFSQGVVIPTDTTQGDFLRAYQFAFSRASTDYRFTSSTMDATLFPKWGEYSVYWVKSGPRRGTFVYPDEMPSGYSSVTTEPYSKYNWRAEDHLALSFKAYSQTVAIFRSRIRSGGVSASWEAVYFRNLFDSFFYPGISYHVDEREIDSSGLSWTTQLLIIPSFSMFGMDARFYVDSMFAASPRLEERLLSFLARGGTIYTEGNAVYVIEKLGILPENAIDYREGILPDPESGTVEVDILPSVNPLSMAAEGAGMTVHASTIPVVQADGAEVIARARGSNVPVVFSFAGEKAFGGKIVCNTALPAVGGSGGMLPDDSTNAGRQFQWILNTMVYAFGTNVDVTRSVYNELPDTLTAGRNAASYDRRDTLEIRVIVRNLSSVAVEGIRIQESIRGFFDFIDVRTEGVEYTYSGTNLTFTGIALPPHSEKVIVYRIATPEPDDERHAIVNNYISWASYIYASYNTTSYTDHEGAVSYRKYRNYVDIMFSARLVADTDLNWKNFLGLYYQPFKVFMMMENKERTGATGTRYVQYVPKDVPFYWTDKSIDIPILKTPGGKYVDILRGSTDEAHPEYDMDNDGHPDAWLDQSSIYPKNYTIEETEVYWLNPWEHLRSGDTRYYEDIDHDGKRAQDTDGDGVVDVEEPGDKIRVWKITWDMGKVAGYEFHDPYCYFELWVDPPDLVPMSAGVAEVYDRLDQDVAGMFYPYSPDISLPDLADTSWTHWMERDAAGNVIWKQLIRQSIGNYEGFTFIDTLRSGYALRPTDLCAGTVPQPHREFIAVLSLGGEEIDMEDPMPEKSEYSNLEYTTIFGETRHCPIRTTYTYYAPLPNPLQFEYVTNNFTITDPEDGRVLPHLPAYGKANLTFDIDASTEYTYYWIRNAGHDVDYNDPSLAQEGVEELGDGVFGYMLYDIPKGMGGYSITLPKKADGSYDVDRIVQVDGAPFRPWLDNPNTSNEIRILEDPFAYHVSIPQILIPPALDDDNFDGIDDWIDDRGDRFQSKTGFLHDGFMLGNGEQYLDYPREPFQDDIYGMVTSGWYGGEDGTYGDDFFETLGKTHVTIRAEYEGQGREGSIDISKGGWLVVEEIFGGSPWVLFSHALAAHAEGVNYQLTSSVTPSAARFGLDTVYVKHVVQDRGEPHDFNANFDPYYVSRGYGETTISTYAGGQDPCGFITPAVTFPTIIDLERDRKLITLMANADPSNPALSDYPKSGEGCFVEVRIEVSNGTDANWLNTTITPVLGEELGQTMLVMNYVSYPRPLVPAKVDPATGRVIRGGDDPGSFRAGWRFNQPEGEVLVKMGSTLPLMQPSRRAYFVFLFRVDDTLSPGIYDIDFTMDGELRSYDGSVAGRADYDVPSCKFSITRRDSRGNVATYQKLVLGQGRLEDIRTDMIAPQFRGLEDVRWSDRDINGTHFDTLRASLDVVYDAESGIETIDLSSFGLFPTPERTRLYMLEKAEVSSGGSDEALKITSGERLRYSSEPFGEGEMAYKALTVSTVGPKLMLAKSVEEVNGRPYCADSISTFTAGEEKNVLVSVDVSNQGSTLAENVVLCVDPGPYYHPVESALPDVCTVGEEGITAQLASLLPGERRRVSLLLRPYEDVCEGVYDSCALLKGMDAAYGGSYALSGKQYKSRFTVPDPSPLDLPAYDFLAERVIASQDAAQPGETIRLYAHILSGVVSPDELCVAFYAIVNERDTMLIGEQYLRDPGVNISEVVTQDFTVPDSARLIEFMTITDPRNCYGEFCEYNNVSSMQLPLRGLDWILDVTNYPNPVQDYALITYVLPEPVKQLTLIVFNLDGRELLRIENAPTAIGRHFIDWRAPELATGTYMYTFEGIDQRGARKTYSGKVVKVE